MIERCCCRFLKKRRGGRGEFLAAVSIPCIERMSYAIHGSWRPTQTAQSQDYGVIGNWLDMGAGSSVYRIEVES